MRAATTLDPRSGERGYDEDAENAFRQRTVARSRFPRAVPLGAVSSHGTPIYSLFSHTSIAPWRHRDLGGRFGGMPRVDGRIPTKQIQPALLDKAHAMRIFIVHHQVKIVHFHPLKAFPRRNAGSIVSAIELGSCFQPSCLAGIFNYVRRNQCRAKTR
jgi:hypothetical protein